jgi:hypothetical protein
VNVLRLLGYVPVRQTSASDSINKRLSGLKPTKNKENQMSSQELVKQEPKQEIKPSRSPGNWQE